MNICIYNPSTDYVDDKNEDSNSSISFEHETSDTSDYLESDTDQAKKEKGEDGDDTDFGFEDREMYLGDFNYVLALEDYIQNKSIEQLEQHFNFHELSAEAQGFYKVFIEERTVDNSSLPNIQLSEDVLKLHFPPPLDIVVKKRLPSCITLINSDINKKELDSIPSSFQILPESIETQIKWILQDSPCKKIPKPFEQCINCISNEPDYCRFQGIRALAYDMKRNIIKTAPRWQEYTEVNVDYPLFSSTNLEAEDASEDEEILTILNEYEKINENLPDIPLIPLYNVDDSIKLQHKRYLLKQSSDSLLRLLSLQLSLFKYTKLYLKKHNESYHHQCDNCKDTLINIYYLNKHCGIEICYRCYLKGDISNLKIMCLKKYNHPIADFIPVTLYRKSTFQILYNSCTEIIRTKYSSLSHIKEKLFIYNGHDSKAEISKRFYKPYVRGTEQEIGLETYQLLMQQGAPFVVHGISQTYIQHFTVKKLANYYGDVYVDQLLSNSLQSIQVQLKEFLKDFEHHKKTSNLAKYRKIIDWPSFEDFHVVFPKLYNAFLNMLPFKQCTHPKGMLNLTSYLPRALYPPDLGPKIYISTGRPRKNPGTTRLGLESTDSIYIMTQSYNSGNEFTTVKCAAIWHIFDSKDTDKIRQYLSFHPKYFTENFTDLIYDRPIYLAPRMLEELKEQYDVTAYQIYQNPGDCIIIPAGCAYQMTALSNCIQISTGYIGPETTTQCLDITQELSQLPGSHPKNGDFAQIANHILYSTSDAISCLLNNKDILITSTFSQNYDEEKPQEQPLKRKRS